MGSCFWNIRTKNYQNLIIGFQVTVENVGDVFLRHSVESMHVTCATPFGRLMYDIASVWTSADTGHLDYSTSVLRH